MAQIIQKVKTLNSSIPPWPEDAKPQLSAIAWTWLKKYGIIEQETKDFLWSDEKQWLIFPIYSHVARYKWNPPQDILIAWQARNFHPVRYKPKYITRGPVGDIFHLLGDPEGDTVIITEDYISAIKVARVCTASPAFGSIISLDKLTTLHKRFKNLGIWLDMDKAGEAVKSKLRASQLGFKKVFTILSPKDPKEYDEETIKAMITVNE